MDIIEVVKLAGATVPALLFVLALFQYYKNSKELRINHEFTRISNLSTIWRSFYNDEKFMSLFIAFEEYETNPQKLEAITKTEKFRFLAFLAEVYNFAEVATVDREKAIGLFQWHFKYIFIENTRNQFWDGMEDFKKGEDISKIFNEPYWNAYYKFAEEINNKTKE